MGNEASGKIVGDLTTKFLNDLDLKDQQIAQLTSHVNRVFDELHDGTLTLDRWQRMDNGNLTILPPEPPDSPPSSNGKGANPLAEPVVAGQPNWSQEPCDAVPPDKGCN